MREKINFCVRENLLVIRVKKKSTWKIQTVREVSEKSIREKRLPYVKKNEKKAKKRFTTLFFFTWSKKTLSKTLVKSLLKILNKLAPSALAGVGLSLDPKGRKMVLGGTVLPAIFHPPQLFVLHFPLLDLKILQLSKKLQMLITFDWGLLDNFCGHFWSLSIFHVSEHIIVFFIRKIYWLSAWLSCLFCNSIFVSFSYGYANLHISKNLKYS